MIVRVLYGASHEQVYHLIPLMLLVVLADPTFIWPNLLYVALTLSISQVLISALTHPFFIKPVIGIRFMPYAR